MRFAAFFDRCKQVGIQCLASFFVLFSIAACEDPKLPPPAEDAAIPSPADAEPGPPSADAGLATDAGGDAAGDAAAADGASARPGDQKAEALPFESGVFTHEGAQVIQALGRAPKSVDLGLARSAAAARARTELKKLLEKQNIESAPGMVQGAEIVRFWRKGRWIYALARLRLDPGPKENSEIVNESSPGASNSAVPTGNNPAPSEEDGQNDE